MTENIKHHRKGKLSKKVKLYHASPFRYSKGQILEGTSKPDINTVIYPVIFMTTSPVPHYTIAEEAYEENWFVYEVKPRSRVIPYFWDDLTTRVVEIIKLVGTSRGLLNNSKPLKDLAPDKGSKVLNRSMLFNWH